MKNYYEMNELRELNRQLHLKEYETASLNTDLQKKIEDIEQATLAQATSTFSPTPLNLSASLNSVLAPLDAKQVETMILELLITFEAKIIQSFDAKFSALVRQQQTNSEPILVATALGAQVSTGLPGLQSPPTIPNTLGATPITLAGAINDYDKTVEVEQRKLRDPDSTPVAKCKWKLAYDIYATNPNKRMTMAEAFGTIAMRLCSLMSPYL